VDAAAREIPEGSMTVKKRKRAGNGPDGGADGGKERSAGMDDIDKQIAADAAALDVLVGLIPEEHYKAPDPDKKLMLSSKYMKKDQSNVSDPR
jgi:hypothetical protein